MLISRDLGAHNQPRHSSIQRKFLEKLRQPQIPQKTEDRSRLDSSRVDTSGKRVESSRTPRQIVSNERTMLILLSKAKLFEQII